VSLDSGNPLGNLFYNNGERVEDFADKNELTHIIALTAHASKQTEEECLRIGMKELVAKPVS
jgi:CheY-like chemotaxis protein